MIGRTALANGSIRNYLTEKDVKNGKSIDIQNQLI